MQILSDGLAGTCTLTHAKVCRYTWIVGSILEFLDSHSMDLLGQAMAEVASKSALLILSKAAISLLCCCCQSGPTPAKPVMIPALGFALRRFPRFLNISDNGASPLSVLKHGLANNGGSCSLRFRMTETLAGLVACYQEAAEADCPSKKKDNATSVAAQKLATLQPELMELISQADEKTIQQASDHSMTWG